MLSFMQDERASLRYTYSDKEQFKENVKFLYPTSLFAQQFPTNPPFHSFQNQM